MRKLCLHIWKKYMIDNSLKLEDEKVPENLRFVMWDNGNNR